MGKQPNRQRCQPKVYTDSDFRRALRDAALNLEKHHIKLCMASFALALHRKLGLDSDQIGDVLAATNEYSVDALCFQDAKKELLEEVGLNLDEFVEEI